MANRVKISLATLLGSAMLTSVTPAIAQPANPSDQEIQEADAAIATGSTAVAGLAGSIASTQDEIAAIELEMGRLREAVNKALVDLHDAQAKAEQARQGVKNARASLDESQNEIEAAQERLDEISRTAYRHATPTPAALAGEKAADDALERQTYLRQSIDKQKRAIDELDRARAENANRESELRVARGIAEEREAEAVAAEAEARSQIQATSAQLESRNRERERLVAERDAAQIRLDEARNQRTALGEQRKEYQEWVKAEEARKKAEEEARKAEEARRKAEEEARRKAEAEEAARKAAEEARQKEEARKKAEAAAKAAREAKEAAERAAAEEKAKQEAESQANAVAGEATAKLVGATQPDHTATTNPYPNSPDASDAPIAAVENAAGTTAAKTAPKLETSESVTKETTATVGGTRAEKIETVIARAKAVIGTPYAWGGGNANGPTLGIRDYGVADSYGDYNKVGFDCSGLVLYAFAGVGISLPHYTGYQYQRGTKVDISNIQRGDLLFWGPNAEYHVAIYLGNGQMLEAPQSGSTVKISPVRYSGMSPYAVRLI